ncbi:unnamed protein product [Triticum turgidum subsp. durum]|uniref:Uncharacterized protein n=1 Tax=Triticum turgidum subsp. durum TaxID=4567 RepID=A0A9R1P013_TRITD|nr:unnamed protein product [Triticum turgidum subsp. durum]
MATYCPSGASALLLSAPRTRAAVSRSGFREELSLCSCSAAEEGEGSGGCRASMLQSFRGRTHPPGGLEEPVAFMGGVFAGLLRLDLNEDPLKEWVTRTVEASGIAEENSTEESNEGAQNDGPQQIEIE